MKDIFDRERVPPTRPSFLKWTNRIRAAGEVCSRQGGAMLPGLVRNKPIMRSGLLIPHYAPQLCWIDLDAGTSGASQKKVNDISMNQIEF